MTRIRDAKEKDLDQINLVLEKNDQMGDVKVYDIKNIVVAVDGGEVVGCGMLKEHKDTVEIRKISVLPKSQGQGIGKNIILSLLNKAEGRSCWLLCVDSTDFWEFFGFYAVTEEDEPAWILAQCEECNRKDECNRTVMIRDVEEL
jgi:N-acetylglutamate synthase-like GNAT family acetyltransferase